MKQFIFSSFLGLCGIANQNQGDDLKLSFDDILPSLSIEKFLLSWQIGPVEEHSVRPWFGQSSLVRAEEIFNNGILSNCENFIDFNKYLSICNQFSSEHDICPIFESAFKECVANGKSLDDHLINWRTELGKFY